MGENNINTKSVANILHRSKICMLKDSVFFAHPDVKLTYVDNNYFYGPDYEDFIELYLAGVCMPHIVFIDCNNEMKIVGGAKYLKALKGYYTSDSIRPFGTYLKEAKDKTYNELDKFLQRRFLETEVRVTFIPNKGFGGYTEKELVNIFKLCC